MLRRLMKQLTSLSAFALMLAATGFAQTSGSLSGEVQDSQGKVIPSAIVKLADPSKNIQLDTTTSDEGTFSFPTLQPGTYMVTIEAPGFKQLIKSGIVINVADRQSAGVLALEPGEVTSTVEVVADAAQLTLKTESGEQGDTITGRQVRDLAINGRNYLDLVKLIPGIVSTVNGQQAGPGGFGSFSINGTRQNQHNLTIDGSTNVDTGSNGTQHVAINIDTIAEFKVLTSNYQAEYGRSSGGDIKIVTRGGGTDFHASGYLFHRHEGLNANSFFNNINTSGGRPAPLPRNLYRYNYFGYNASGPIYLPRFGEGGPSYTDLGKRLFFFYGQEWQKQLLPSTARQVRVPTAAELSGDFSATRDGNGNLVAIRDPLTGQLFPGGRIPAAGSPGCGVTQSCASPSGRAILGLFNQFENNPTSLPGFNHTSQFSAEYPRRQETIRVDYNVTDNTRMFARFTQDSDQQVLPYGLGWTSGQNFPLTPTIFKQGPARNAALNITSTLSPTMTNEFVFGPSQNNLTLTPVNPTAGTLRGIGTTFATPFPYPDSQFVNITFAGTPGQTFAGITNYDRFPYKNSNTTFDFYDNLSKVFGNHTAKVGVYVQRSRKDQAAGASMLIAFGNDANNPGNTNHPFANALLGNFDTFREPTRGIYQGQYRSTNVEFYIQDNWKATRRLTLDYGMRFNWIQPQNDQRDQDSYFVPEQYDRSKTVRLYNRDVSGRAFDPAAPTTLLPSYLIGRIVPGSGEPFNGMASAANGYLRGGIKNRGLQLGPAVGFAYDVFADQSTVVRGGYRIGYDRVSGNNLIFPAAEMPPVFVNPEFRYGTLDTVGLNTGTIALAPSAVLGADPEGYIPNVHSYSLQVQREVGFDTVVSVAYVGSLSRHLQELININYIPYGATFRRENQDPAAREGGNLVFPGGVIPEVEPGLPDVYRQAGFNFSGRYALPADFLRRYPGYGTIGYRTLGGSANYHSLQATAQRRFNSGFTYGVSYTYSKAMGTANADGDFINPVCSRCVDYRRLAFDRTHVMAINYVWDLPRASRLLGDNAVAKVLFDNWELSGISQFATGQPEDVTIGIPNVNLNQRITGSWTEAPRPVLIGDATGNQTREQWFDYTAVALPAIGSTGSGSRNFVTRPGTNVTDLSVFKNIPYGGADGSRYLQLRVEMFNIFNNPQFNDINRGLTYNIASNFSNYATNRFASPQTVQNTRGGPNSPSAATDRLGRAVGEVNTQPGYVSSNRVIQLALKLYF